MPYIPVNSFLDSSWACIASALIFMSLKRRFHELKQRSRANEQITNSLSGFTQSEFMFYITHVPMVKYKMSSKVQPWTTCSSVQPETLCGFPKFPSLHVMMFYLIALLKPQQKSSKHCTYHFDCKPNLLTNTHQLNLSKRKHFRSPRLTAMVQRWHEDFSVL